MQSIDITILLTMNIEQAADKLAELGHVTRLSIYRALVNAGHQGLPVSDIKAKLTIPGSTLSHHISRLIRVGLVKQDRDGRVLWCKAQYSELGALMDFLTKECCKDS